MLFLDFLLLIMIIVCVVYCWILNQRIGHLQNSRIEFARMIKELNASIVKAETNVNEMSQLSKITSTEIRAVVEEARENISELKSINQIATDVSNTLNEQMKNLNETSNEEEFVNSYENVISARSGERFSEEDLAELANNQSATSYANNLKNFIQNIVTKKSENNQTLNQANYYETLRKINVKK